jgi:hypothetical protein
MAGKCAGGLPRRRALRSTVYLIGPAEPLSGEGMRAAVTTPLDEEAAAQSPASARAGGLSRRRCCSGAR